MLAIALVGAQWGDEGKGKATDLLGDRVHYVVRYEGGNNAGHTVVIGAESYALHMLPSGVLSPEVVPVIGNGVVVDPRVLLEEIDALQAPRGVLREAADLGDAGPDHAVPPGPRQGDGTLPWQCADRYYWLRTGHLRLEDRPGRHTRPGPVRTGTREAWRCARRTRCSTRSTRGAIELAGIADEYIGYGERLRDVADTGLVLGRALDAGRVVLLEGAQATMLDVDDGTYRVRDLLLADCCGVARIGHRPLISSRSSGSPRPTPRGSVSVLSPPNRPTSRANGCAGPAASTASRRGGPAAPAGSTPLSRGTRPGRTGSPTTSSPSWTCCPAWTRCPCAWRMRSTGRALRRPAHDTDRIHHARPLYEYLDGWAEDVWQAQTFADLLLNAERYAQAIEEMIGALVCAVGVRPRRDQTLQIRDLIVRRRLPPEISR